MSESPSLRIDRGCVTADCAGVPVRLVKLIDVDGDGPFPYCAECAETLLRGGATWGEIDCGPFDPVTEEMVDRAAAAMKAVPVGLATWDVLASAALTAALGQEGPQ